MALARHISENIFLRDILCVYLKGDILSLWSDWKRLFVCNWLFCATGILEQTFKMISCREGSVDPPQYLLQMRDGTPVAESNHCQ